MPGFQLSGEELRRVVSWQAKEGSDLLQIGGMRYHAKRSTGRVLELIVGGKPVDRNRRYSVVTNEYVVGHDLKYFGFELEEREIIDLGWIDRELIQKVFAEGGVVSSRIDKRIMWEE